MANSTLFAVPLAANFLVDIESADALPTSQDDLNTQTLYTKQIKHIMQ